jgi:hypothetical protein
MREFPPRGVEVRLWTRCNRTDRFIHLPIYGIIDRQSTAFVCSFVAVADVADINVYVLPLLLSVHCYIRAMLRTADDRRQSFDGRHLRRRQRRRRQQQQQQQQQQPCCRHRSKKHAMETAASLNRTAVDGDGPRTVAPTRRPTFGANPLPRLKQASETSITQFAFAVTCGRPVCEIELAVCMRK